jgi:perosamine synthetase
MLPRSKPTYSVREIWEVFANTLSGVDSISSLRSTLAAYYQVRHVFLFSRAREALFALLQANGQPGEVLIPAYNCISVSEAIRNAGYTPVFVDIDLKTLNFQLEDLEKRISSRTKAILITHQFGIPAEIETILGLIKKHKLLLIEDAAPAFGARYHSQLVGTFCDAAILSFEKTKVLTGIGGGALLIKDDELANKVQASISRLLPARSLVVDLLDCLGFMASTDERLYSLALFLYRFKREENLYEIAEIRKSDRFRHARGLSRFQAGLIHIQLSRIDQIFDNKKRISSFFMDRLAGDKRFKLPVIPDLSSPTWSQFPILTNSKEEVFRKMRKLGVDLSWNFKYSCPESYGISGYPNSHIAAKSVLGLPTYPSLDESTCAQLCEKLSR